MLESIFISVTKLNIVKLFPNWFVLFIANDWSF